MSEQVPAPILNVTEEVMIIHLVTFMIQYIASIQHITDKQQLVYEIFHSWEKKFNQSINMVKKATAETLAEDQEEDQDIWNIILDINNTHVEDVTKEFLEKMRTRILKNLKLV